MLKAVQIGIVLFVIGIFIFLGLGITDNGVVDIGDPAYNFVLEDVNGDTYKLSDYKGQLVILNFFTSWCQPCIDEAPELEAFYQEYKNEVVFLVIDRGESKGQVKKYIDEHNSALTYLLDFNNNVSTKYKISGQPETIIIDKDGIIREHISGMVTKNQLAEKVKQYQ